MSVGITNPQTVYQTGAYPVNSGVFIPEIWSKQLNKKFYKATCLNEICNRNWEGEIKNIGDKIHIQDIGTVTIGDYTKGKTLTYQDLVDTDIEMTVDYAKDFACKVDNIDKYQANRNKLSDWAADAAEQMKIAIDTVVLQAIYADPASGNYGATAGADSGNINLGTTAAPLELDGTNIIDWIVDCGQVLDEQSVPEDSRWMVIPPSLAAKIKKSDLKNASITGDNQSVLRNGRIGQVDRFTLYTSRLLRKYTTTAWYVLAGHPSAVTFASQFSNVEYFDKLEQTFGSAVRGLNVFGFKTVRTEGLLTSIVSL